MKKTLTTIAVALTITSFQIAPAIAQLNPTNPTPSTQQGAGTSATSQAVRDFGNRAFGTSGRPRTPVEIAITAIKIILGLLGIIAVILIIYAGFQWMTAAGDANKVGSAKSLLINAAIGLVIILSAYAIAEFVSSIIIASIQ